MIWDEFNEDKIFKNTHEALYELLFLGRVCNITYFGGVFFNIYLHDGILQYLFEKTYS
jgi:hypothetical protein